MAHMLLLYTLLLSQLIPPTNPLTPYSSCASIFISSDLMSNECLPPTTDCLCYADAYYLELVAIDIQGHCSNDTLSETAQTLMANCAELNQTPAMDSAEFIAAGVYIASDTIYSPSVTFEASTVPGATVTQSVESILTSFPGVTVIPGPGPTSSMTGTFTFGPVSVSTASTTAMTASSTAQTAASSTATTKSSGASGLEKARQGSYVTVGLMCLQLGWGLIKYTI